MFNIGPEEFVVLALVGVIVFGPDKLPQLAKQAAQMIRTLREMSSSARKHLSELSPELGESLGELNSVTKGGLGGISAKSALQKMIFADDDDPLGASAMRDEPTAVRPDTSLTTVDPRIVQANAMPIPAGPPPAGGTPPSLQKDAVAAPSQQTDAVATPPLPNDTTSEPSSHTQGSTATPPSSRQVPGSSPGDRGGYDDAAIDGIT